MKIDFKPLEKKLNEIIGLEIYWRFYIDSLKNIIVFDEIDIPSTKLGILKNLVDYCLIYIKNSKHVNDKQPYYYFDIMLMNKVNGVFLIDESNHKFSITNCKYYPDKKEWYLNNKKI